MKGGAKTLLVVAVMATAMWAYEPPWGYIWNRTQACDFGGGIKKGGYPTGWVKYTRTDNEDLYWTTSLLDTSGVGYWRYRFTTDNCPPSGYYYRVTGWIGGPICERIIYFSGGSRFDIQLYSVAGGK